MKKLFIALMAVLVLASCGKKKEVVETPGDVATIMAACANEVADKLEKADNAEQVVEAFEQYANGLLDMYSNNKELFNALDEMDEEQLLQSYPEPMAELAKAKGKLEYAEASGKDVDAEIGTESTIEIDEEQPTTKKKSSKK